MNYELLAAIGAVGGCVVLAFLYARASTKATLVDQFTELNKGLGASLAVQRAITSAKEEYIRELEKTVLGSVPASQLAARLTLLFAAARGRQTSVVPASKP